MDIFWGVVVLLLVVGPTVAALAVRREDPARPWFPAGSDGAWPGGGAWDDRSVHGDRWDRDAQRLDADLRAAADRADAQPEPVHPHEVAAELVVRRVVPNPAVRDGVRRFPPAPATPVEPAPSRAGRRVRLPR
ncbi:hypothetical protein JN535_13970 [Cellulosimicrobium cellulans]|uniref:hypothetical protein n=1 Tax=Cellulosimicrobium cellulans TaxID=1710 RepID=UPI001962ACC0|nr:hypothetical protein [Cellulosimicrobium cellulans]MBN0041269.1 hypothetical protein [Cellulosimicrobium cellulans]